MSVRADRAETERSGTEVRLLDAALTLFAERGYEATSVRTILEAVGVTAPVLYHHFGSKKQLFEQLVRWTHDDALAELEAEIDGEETTVARLRSIVRGTFAFCVRDPRVPRVMFQTWYGPTHSELRELVQQHAEGRFVLVARVMQRGLDEGDLAGGDAAALALVLCSLMDHHVGSLSLDADPARNLTEARADALLDVFLRAMGTRRRGRPELPPLELGA